MGTGPPLSGMSLTHPFGVDQLGRDVFSRVVHGGHIVILLSLSGTFLGLVIGAAVGLLSGYVGGWLDEVAAAAARSADQHSVPGAGADRHRGRRAEILGQSDPAHPGGRARLRAAHRPHGARRGARHRDARLRDGRQAARRVRLVGRAARASAQRDQRAPGRVRAARRLCAGADRLAGLPRLRAAAADPGMGPDDQREPLAHHVHADHGARARADARLAGRRPQPLHRRPGADPRAAPSGSATNDAGRILRRRIEARLRLPRKATAGRRSCMA